MSEYKFEFDLSISIQDVLDADDGKINLESSTSEDDQKNNTIEKIKSN